MTYANFHPSQILVGHPRRNSAGHVRWWRLEIEPKIQPAKSMPFFLNNRNKLILCQNHLFPNMQGRGSPTLVNLAYCVGKELAFRFLQVCLKPAGLTLVVLPNSASGTCSRSRNSTAKMILYLLIRMSLKRQHIL